MPRGVTFLLEVAAGESESLRNASALTGRTEANLKNAAGFFIEQVLLSETADNYRVLGSKPESPHGELRRHMALIMRWLHPDIVSSDGMVWRLDRGLYAGRVTKAWEAIKTEDRRASYDASFSPSARQERSGRRDGSRPLLIPAAHDGSPAVVARRRKTQCARVPARCNSFWGRVRLLLAGRP